MTILDSIPENICEISRKISPLRYKPGDSVTVTVTGRLIQGDTTITETFPPDWTVSDAGGGTVDMNNNTIAFTLTTDGEVAYELTAPGGDCPGNPLSLSGTYAGAGGCDGDVDGASQLRCLVIGGDGLFFDFDAEEPTIEEELPDFFDFFGFDPNLGSNWTIQENFLNLDDPYQALRTNSNDNQLANYFAGARALAREAGFSSFEKLPIQNPFNQFFALRR